MKLTDLNPRWIHPQSFSVAIPTGISFDCPHCGKQRLSVRFRNAIDPEGLLANTTWRVAEPAWDRTGDTFETLSLAPSIDFTAGGHWHGHITNGEVHSS